MIVDVYVSSESMRVELDGLDMIGSLLVRST